MPSNPEKKEITTNTIAELYLRQGYPEKALDIYRAVLELDPGNKTARERLREIEARMRGGAGGEPADRIDAQIARLEEWLNRIRSMKRGEIREIAAPEVAAAAGVDEIDAQIARLEQWLSRIRSVRGDLHGL